MGMGVSLKGKDISKLYEQVEHSIEKILPEIGTKKARIFNGTKETVVFYVYNYIDTVYWVAAQHTMVAPGKAGDVSASGNRFKVHPDDNHKAEFLVEPGKVYIYAGPGDLTEVKK